MLDTLTYWDDLKLVVKGRELFETRVDGSDLAKIGRGARSEFNEHHESEAVEEAILVQDGDVFVHGENWGPRELKQSERAKSVRGDFSNWDAITKRVWSGRK